MNQSLLGTEHKATHQVTFRYCCTSNEKAAVRRLGRICALPKTTYQRYVELTAVLGFTAEGWSHKSLLATRQGERVRAFWILTTGVNCWQLLTVARVSGGKSQLSCAVTWCAIVEAPVRCARTESASSGYALAHRLMHSDPQWSSLGTATLPMDL